MAGILIVNSSPRRGGNCAHLRDVAAAALEEGKAEHESIDLAGLRIGPCTACDLCKEKKAKYCAVRDDMQALYEKVLGCEGLLLVSPVYWFNYSAQLKLFVDRLYGLWQWDNDFLRGKKAGAALVYGDVDVYASGGINAISSFEHLFRFTGALSCGFAYGTANDIGDAEKNTELVERTRSLARSML